MEVNVVQPHQLQLLTAKAQTCDKRGHIIDHAVLRQAGVFQLDDALCLAADQARIVDHPSRALDLPTTCMIATITPIKTVVSTIISTRGI